MTGQYSVVIPWRDRAELETTLTRNRPFFERHGAEIVIVNAGGNGANLIAMIARTAVANVVAVNLPDATFNRGLCLNLGQLVSSGEYLFHLDADIVMNSDIFAEARPHLASDNRFVAVGRIFESKTQACDLERWSPDLSDRLLSCVSQLVRTTELTSNEGRRAVTRFRLSRSGLRAGEGLVLMKRSHLEEVGGLNSSFKGWGYEDTDLQIRLQFKLGLERVEAGEVVHLSHDAVLRDELTWRHNRDAGLENYGRGHYSGTLQQDITEWSNALTVLWPRDSVGAELAV
jgi:GT2 family glycosyltransferase